MPRLRGTPCREVTHVHGCLLQDLIFHSRMQFRGKPREGREGEVFEGCRHWRRQRCKVAVPKEAAGCYGLGRDCWFSVAPS